MEFNPKILIVDDSHDNLKVMLDCLFNGGYLNTLCAINGTSALEIAEKELPDLIILDWDMPVMNGLEVLKKLQSNPDTRAISVIIATGAMLSPEDLQLALNSGAKDYIRKPFEHIELLARVKSALDFAIMVKTIVKQTKYIEEQKCLLEENYNRLNALMLATNEACIFVRNGLIIEANPVFFIFTGYEREEVINHPFLNFFPKDVQKKLIETGDKEEDFIPVILLKKNGETLNVEMVTRQFDYNEKKVQAVSFINFELKQNSIGENINEMHATEYEGNWEENNRRLRSINQRLLNQLQLKTIQCARNNDLMAEILQCFNELKLTVSSKPDCWEHLNRVNAEIKKHLNKDQWKEFNLRFAELHTGFYDNLMKKYPRLTETDLRLCAFIKLKMSTKEIAELINQPVNSVKVARNRLRSKLQIEDASESLLLFLSDM